MLQQIDPEAIEIISASICERCWNNVGQASVERVHYNVINKKLQSSRSVIVKHAVVPAKLKKGGATKAAEKLESFFVEVPEARSEPLFPYAALTLPSFSNVAGRLFDPLRSGTGDAGCTSIEALGGGPK